MPIFATLLLAFKAWMLIDSIQRCGSRCGNSYWILICWFPFGDWAYFFAVKIHDPEFKRFWARLLARSTSLDDLRYGYKVNPSAANRLILAQGLHDKGAYEEALAHSDELLRFERDNKNYQYLHASCLVGLKRYSEAIPLLEQLLEKDFAFKNYEAATALATLHVEEKHPDKAIEVYRRIVRSSSQLRYQVNFACLLNETGHEVEAKQLLDDAVQQFRHEPRFIQRRDRKELGVAKKMLKSFKGRVPA